MYDFVYDNESYKNIFTVGVKNMTSGKRQTFEMSEWKNDYSDLRQFMRNLKTNRCRMIGFRNLFYDYPQLHHVLKTVGTDTDWTGLEIAELAKEKSDEIIATDIRDQWSHVIWDNNVIVPQIDLFTINHFDNKAKLTSLKMLEFNMRSENIRELPYDPSTRLSREQADNLISYNDHDIDQTEKFANHCADKIRFREELTVKHGKNFMNFNDTKIGKQYFIMQLDEAGVKCYGWDVENNKRVPVQTPRRQIYVEDIIFPYITFDRPEFTAMLSYLKKQVIRQTKGVFTELDPDSLGDLEQYSDLKKKKGAIATLNCIVNGLKFVFGTGGIHASVDPNIYISDDKWTIIDIDVTSFYPSLIIVNNLYPEHLTEKFVNIYSRLKTERLKYDKKSTESAMLKLALNGTYGETNNRYSVFYDPQCTMSVTINGQLLLCKLAEMIMEVSGVKILQVNTDGLTVKIRRSDVVLLKDICTDWEAQTQLDLEYVTYDRMFIRDVNNYIAEYEDGSVKRKGAFEYKADWHQNHSALVTKMATEAYLLYGTPVREFVENHDNIWDFFLRTKVPRSSRLVWEQGGEEHEQQKITRYYISKDGGTFTKIMPPLPKNPDLYRRIGINKGWKVTPVNEFTGVDMEKIDYSFYVKEAEKLVKPLVAGFTNDLFQ